MRSDCLSLSGESFTPLQPALRLCPSSYREMPGRLSPGTSKVLFFQFHTAADDQFYLPIVPDMCIDILFCCCHTAPRAYICGSLLQSRVIHFKSGCDYFGVRLWPENSIRTSRLQLRELLNQEIPFQDVWSISSSLPERIAGSSSFAERAELFQEFGCSLITEEPSGTSRMVTHCIRAIIQGTGSVPIHSLAQEVGYTSRYLRKKFEEEVGVSPKLFSRIIRFQHALQQLSRCEHDMLDVVAANDYYDQSHLIHEFKKFDFLSPSEWVRLNARKVH